MQSSVQIKKSQMVSPVHQKTRQSIDGLETTEKKEHKSHEIKWDDLREDSLHDHNKRNRMFSLQDTRLLPHHVNAVDTPSHCNPKSRATSIDGKQWAYRDRAASLEGKDLAYKAYDVTRRLSRSQYMQSSESVSAPINIVRVENTYKTVPDDGKRFSTFQVQKVITDVLHTSLRDRRYIAGEASRWSCHISDAIKAGVKELNFPRYKIVCNVFIAEKAQQGLSISSLVLSDKKTDTYACGTFNNDTITAVATVHGIYFE